MGLPSYLWYQLTNLLFKVDATMNSDLTCSDADGGHCSLKNACATYTNLWTNGWSFKVMFTGATNYVLVPLGALAADDDSGVCQIYIQYLNDAQN
jgi:hypothetical protein